MELLDVVRSSAPYLQSWLEFQLGRSRVPGVQAAVRVGPKLGLSCGLGYADALAGVAMNVTHLFHIASHSKTFTATAVMQLVEAGRLRLDDAVADWLPDLRDFPSGSYTVRELLGHMSGINRDGEQCDYWQLDGEFPDTEKLMKFAQQDAVYATNEHFKYSNVGFSIAGAVVEAAAGCPYNEYVRANIVDVLGLAQTGPEVPEERVGELAAAHGARWRDDDQWRVIPHVGTNAFAAATGFYGTAEDVTLYLQAHADGNPAILSEDSKRLMRHVEGRVTRGGERFYGLGFIMCDVNGRRLIGHSGGWPGHITQSWLDPATGLAVSVFTNGLASPASEWALGLIKLIDLATEFAADPYSLPDGFDPATVVGRYQNMWGVHDLAVLGGELVAVSPALPDPMVAVDRLTVVDACTFTTKPEAGFGSVGEPTCVEYSDGGGVSVVRSGGMSAWPVDEYRRRSSSF